MVKYTKTWADVKIEAVNACEGYLSIEDFLLYLNDNYQVVEITENPLYSE